VTDDWPRWLAALGAGAWKPRDHGAEYLAHLRETSTNPMLLRAVVEVENDRAVDVAEHLACGCGICEAEQCGSPEIHLAAACPAVDRAGDVTFHCLRSDPGHLWHVNRDRSWQ
jgi:hypothetical protein